MYMYEIIVHKFNVNDKSKTYIKFDSSKWVESSDPHNGFHNVSTSKTAMTYLSIRRREHSACEFLFFSAVRIILVFIHEACQTCSPSSQWEMVQMVDNM